jgi:hypothetical protein
MNLQYGVDETSEKPQKLDFSFFKFFLTNLIQEGGGIFDVLPSQLLK